MCVTVSNSLMPDCPLFVSVGASGVLSASSKAQAEVMARQPPPLKHRATRGMRAPGREGPRSLVKVSLQFAVRFAHAAASSERHSSDIMMDLIIFLFLSFFLAEDCVLQSRNTVSNKQNSQSKRKF